MLTGRRSRLPTHALISLSRTDPLHTLPLATLLALCRAVRSLAWTTILLGNNFHIVRMARMSKPRAVREAARLSSTLLQSGLVRQDRRGAAEARVPRLSVCVVRCVARAARGRSAHIREDIRHTRRFEQ